MLWMFYVSLDALCLPCILAPSNFPQMQHVQPEYSKFSSKRRVFKNHLHHTTKKKRKFTFNGLLGDRLPIDRVHGAENAELIDGLAVYEFKEARGSTIRQTLVIGFSQRVRIFHRTDATVEIFSLRERRL